MWRQVKLLLGSLILLTACQGRGGEAVVYHAPEMPTLSLQTALVTSQKVPRYYSATGYTNVARRIEVSTSQAGSIKKLQVNEGDRVKAGDLLIVIDESELFTAIKQAKTAIQSAKINLKDRQYDFKTAQRLSQTRVIPAEQFRKAQVQLELARSQLTQANSELKRQQVRKPYYRITSPINARVVKRWVNQGDLAVTGKPLLQLEAIQGLEFETALPVQWISRIKVGDQHQLKLHDSDKTINAKVSHIIHSTNRITQTCQVKLSLPDSNTLSAGLSGQVNFKVAEENHLLIPEVSLIKRAGVQGVFRVDKNRIVRFTPVKTERLWKKQWIVLSGLEAGESVVLNPAANLRDGTHIKMASIVE